MATTGTNMNSATKYGLWGEGNFSTTIGKANRFSRNNAGVGTLERMIFVEGTTFEAAKKTVFMQKCLSGKILV